LGGTNQFNNLYAACILCNRKKINKSTSSIRRKHGLTRAPLSRYKREEVKKANSFSSAVIGGLLGSIFGPWGAITFAAICAKIGYDRNPDID